MKSLSFPELLAKIGKAHLLVACASAFTEGKFPLEIAGCEGALGTLRLARLFAARPGLYVAVVPQEIDAAELALDLAASGLPVLTFPWWGAVPYRELNPLSAVFGERVKVLSELALGKPGIVIVPQRAFLNPLPPSDYIKSLLVSLKPGGGINTRTLAETLASYGYTRVPRVQMHGEFALRGEVLDILMGGDYTAQAAEAYRVLFDFDRIESIKPFDPINQGSGPGRETLPELVIRPMREVVWTDGRIEKLGDKLSAFQEFTDGGKAIMEDLISFRCIQGEELFYPLAFDSPGNLLDYLGVEGTLVLFGRERLEKAQESLVHEYKSLYAHSFRGKNDSKRPYEYPLPERLLLDFNELVKGQRRIVSFKAIKSEPESGCFRFNIPCEP
ncbi:MAG: transcription-repair coupling factor, partial [Treponema sp.]|nr:transcription-repair coupling factor [Treponema sp.]